MRNTISRKKTPTKAKRAAVLARERGGTAY